MPRTSRIKSPSGIYHIILRGVNRHQIFFDDEDYYCFLSLLDKYKSVSGYEIYAYCLMGNHIHLLIKEGKEEIGIVFRRIGAAFAWWYNTKYDRAGHIFQDRFKSEAIDTQKYLFTVLRYILQNPVAAGLCRTPADYPYSSAREYLRGEEGITDTSYFREAMGYEGLRQFVVQDNDDVCMEMELPGRKGMIDSAAKERIIEEFGTLTPNVGKKNARQAFDASIMKLYKDGIAIRQLSRLTGISRGVLQRSIGKK